MRETGPREVAALLTDDDLARIQWRKRKNVIPDSQSVYIGRTTAENGEETFIVATKQRGKPYRPRYSYRRAEIAVLLKGSGIFEF